ncbi:MAG TPA: methyltransferase domain-containing protein [Leptolyngbyaceae cyanobacterium M65_K2018_010]|nr:methyltransferase domain-containing protein [Leptolyngbyaceae cyanobacterium M65_K2018_010]
MPAPAIPPWTTRVVNQLLAIKPLWNLARGQARAMMVKRAESIGVSWPERVQELRSRHGDLELSPLWQTDLEALQNPELTYPGYYTTSFHAYDEGNLGWQPAMEVEVAALAVHTKLWPGAGAQGDARLRQSYHEVLAAQLPQAPEAIVDLGCGVGMSTETLQALYPQAQITGVDLSPYFLAVAQYRQQENAQGGHSQPLEEAQSHDSANAPDPTNPAITWHHAAAENTGLPSGAYDLVSACLVFHELPQSAAQAVIHEAHRLLRPGGHLAIMDMNPQSEVYKTMPPFVFTLLKSTEPYLDEYFSLDIAAAFAAAGFEPPRITCNSPRHRTIIGRVG